MIQEEYLKATSKKIAVANLSSGDVVKTKSEAFPLIYHYGIIEVDYNGVFIYHNQPDKINHLGGSLIRENFNDYIKGKELVSVVNLDLDKKELYSAINILVNKKYNVFKNNCEHYINFIKEGKYTSPQVKNWVIVSSLIIGLFFLNRKYKFIK